MKEIKNNVGYLWYWNKDENPFFLSDTFCKSRLDCYELGRKKWDKVFKGGLKEARKKGLRIMRVRLVPDGWER